ncbi:MAG: glycosyltransferase family 4 protein [Oligoflexia bacterium]|nr:glycosyltransferase family 4 protein [Oligoflexia bacterium]
MGTFPFPVHISACKEDEIAEGQTSVRDQLRLGREEFVFAYAGRISVQKNVLLLIKEFLKIRVKHNNVRLLIAGEFDQILSAHFGFRHNNGIYFELINEFLDSLSSELKASIIFLGHLNRRDLTRVYKETDCFVSLSTFHDEDFGMAPAEALCQGVPAILTNWAGYSGFRGPGVRFVEVRPSPLGAFINTLDLQNHFQAVLKNRENPQLLRGLIRSHFEQKFSVKSLSALLDSELANLSRIRLFEGFKNRAVLLSKGLGSPEAFGDDVHNMKDYMEVYAPYFN